MICNEVFLAPDDFNLHVKRHMAKVSHISLTSNVIELKESDSPTPVKTGDLPSIEIENVTSVKCGGELSISTNDSSRNIKKTVIVEDEEHTSELEIVLPHGL